MSGDLDRRLEALAAAADLAEGRLDDEYVAEARAVVRRAGQRIGLGLETTVVALAGPTSAGKSSVLNALAGEELTAAGARRPTTAAAPAAVWGHGADSLLDWLDVPRRHRRAGGAADGLVLIDLPDFDSIEFGHRLEVERLLELVDLVVWVVDPQKYADAALHDRYLRPLAGHRAAMLVVLNQSDRLAPDAVAACRADLARLLSRDGLDGTGVLAVSARTGEGLEDLRRVIDGRVASRTAALERLAADATSAAAPLAAGCAGAVGGQLGRDDRSRLVDALAEAAGVPTVVRAVVRAHRRRGALATGWPFVRWVRRLRPDPLRRLHLQDTPDASVRTSLPHATPVQRAQVSAAARALAAQAAGDLPTPWPSLVRGAATAREDEVADSLDRAVAGADLHSRPPRWWTAGRVLQAALAAMVAAGALWLVLLAGLGWLRLSDVLPLPDVLGIPLPTLLLGGGVLAGLLLAALTRAVNGVGARRRGRAAEASMRDGVEDVADRLVVVPVEAELAARERLCATAAQAAGEGGRRRRGLRRARASGH